MQLNVLNDLAKAKRRWTEKSSSPVLPSGEESLRIVPSVHRPIYIAIPIPEVIQCYHLFLHFPIAYELISWPPAVLVFVFVLVWIVCFLCFCLFCLCFWCLFFVLHGDSSMDLCIDPFQFSFVSHCHCFVTELWRRPLISRRPSLHQLTNSLIAATCNRTCWTTWRKPRGVGRKKNLLYHIVIMTSVAAALIRWICTMQLSFQLDKRPGESLLALDDVTLLKKDESVISLNPHK